MDSLHSFGMRRVIYVIEHFGSSKFCVVCSNTTFPPVPDPFEREKATQVPANSCFVKFIWNSFHSSDYDAVSSEGIDLIIKLG